MIRHLCRVLFCCLLGGCLPALDSECTTAADCADGRACVGGLCVALDAPDDGLDPDAAPDGADPDRDPPADAAPDDAAPHDAAPDGGEPICTPIPGACNGLDDDCDDQIDEPDEAAEGCGGPRNTTARCRAGNVCELACAEGALPIDADITAGCVVFAGCALDETGWRVVQARFRGAAADDVQQLALAIDGERRLIARYDVNANGNEPVLVLARFDGLDGELTFQRAGDVPNDFQGGHYAGLAATPLGDAFAVSAWRRLGDDAGDRLPILRVPFDGLAVLRSIHLDWPQPPAVLADGAGLLAVVETRDRGVDPPRGGVWFDRWDGLTASAEDLAAVEPTHAVGPAQDIAWRLPDGGLALLSDSRTGPDDATPALRIARYDAALAPLGAVVTPLAAPALDRLTIGPPHPDGRLALALVDDPASGLAWFRVTADGLTPVALGPPLVGAARSARVLDLPVGPAALYRSGDTVRLVVVSERGHPLVDAPLPDVGADLRQIDAQPVDGGFELVALRGAGGQTFSVEHARYTCR
ncbi:MAG: hypothetical protein H6701_05645 [Myxococcales bacterium]|nr:hypothetical protein [Myxococcales bacterium]